MIKLLFINFVLEVFGIFWWLIGKIYENVGSDIRLIIFLVDDLMFFGEIFYVFVCIVLEFLKFMDFDV